MQKSKYKHWPVALKYAEDIRDGKITANEERKQAVDRFFRDLENPAYEPRLVPLRDFETGAARIVGVAVRLVRNL